MVNATFPKFVAVSQDRSWSSTIQVYIKLLGAGFDLDKYTARILTAATMSQAEPALMDRCPATDRLALNRLKYLCEHMSRNYGHLLCCIMGDETQLKMFYQDYRQTSFGFAVIHCREYSDFIALAKENNRANHLSLTVVKEVRASVYPPFVCSERIILVFNDNFYDKGFRMGATITVKAACQEFHDKTFPLKRYELNLEGIAIQTPRPLLTPHLEKIVQEHLKFFYSKRIGRFISAGFYSGGRDLHGIPTPPQAPLSLEEVKTLLRDSTNTSFLNIQQFREFCDELEELGDTDFLARMKDREAVETFRPTYLDIPDLNISIDYDDEKRAIDVFIKPRLFSIFDEVKG
jgi:hypothetical protein